ncbi:MAG TPA: App1 family protein [Thermoplasmata archaeon]|nr:App1 family protein [Thermoplasmata archaeon]
MSLSRIVKAMLGFFCLISTCHGSPLKSDESVFFFPTSANQDKNLKWNIPIHHWVFEKEEDGIGNIFTQKVFSEIAETLEVTEEQAHSELFRKRLGWFLVDNERNKKIEICLENKQKEQLELTSANGHATTAFTFETKAQDSTWLSYKVLKDDRLFEGKVQLIPKTGLTVISDIDDTIKVSEVLDKKTLIKNTFLEPFKATAGMPEYYKKLQEQGAYFHYVSASPWQLYPSLELFMEENYPAGTVSLRNFRLKDSSILKFLKSSENYKTAQIRNIIQRYPKHQFILIGDSGEHDPEVYAAIYEQFPTAIKSIQIRAVTNSDLSDQRFNATFKEVPKRIWKLFSEPNK